MSLCAKSYNFQVGELSVDVGARMLSEYGAMFR